MRILITGVTGMVGNNLLKQLLALDLMVCEIAVLVRDKESFKLFPETYKCVEYISSLEIDCKKEIIKFNPEVVIHLASYLTSKDDEDSIDQILFSNINFGVNLLNALEDTQIKCFINVGSSAEYLHNDGELRSAYLYAASKTAFRPILKYYSDKIGFKWINVIPYTIYGGNDRQKKVLDYIISSLYAKKAIPMSGGEQVLDFIHIDDVVDFFITLLNNIDNISNEYIEFHLGTGIGISIKELSSIVEQVYNKPTHINWGELPYRKMDVMQAIAHTSKNKDILNWEAKVDIRNGIYKMKMEMEQHG